MAKKCVVNRDSQGVITSISVENVSRQVGEKSEVLDAYLKKNKKSELANKIKENRELYEMSIDNYINELISINQIMRDLNIETKTEFYKVMGELRVPIKVSIDEDFLKEARKIIKNGATFKQSFEVYKIPKLAYTAIKNGWVMEPIGKFERGEIIKPKQLPQEIINSIVEDRRNGMAVEALYDKYKLSQNLIRQILKKYNVRQIERNEVTGHFYKHAKKIPYQSEKLGKWITGDSTYEIARFMELDADLNVETYTRNVKPVKLENGGKYYPDIKVTYTDGRVEIEEIKPKFIINKARQYSEMLTQGMTDSAMQKEFNLSDSMFDIISKVAIKTDTAEKYYAELGIPYKIMTEDNIDIDLSNYSSITKLSKKERLEMHKREKEGIQEKEYIPSQLYDEIKQQPFINPEQALDMYKNIYTDEMDFWKDDSQSEC